ncbi:hypothetical protein CO614_11410 [Lysobacteraceae bacterium NML120232]|nr:hypothetical protein CO614_11410 [Xanthomonadaceae bacterium NML120232]
MKKYLGLALALLLLPFSLQAQSCADESPETVALRLNTALEQGEWYSAASEFDPVVMKEVRRLLMEILATTPKAQRELTAALIFKTLSLDNLSHVDDETFFADYLGGEMRSNKGRIEDAKVIGSIAEAPDLAHVLISDQRPTASFQVRKMDVISLRCGENGWRVQLTGDIRELEEVARTFMKYSSELLDPSLGRQKN